MELPEYDLNGRAAFVTGAARVIRGARADFARWTSSPRISPRAPSDYMTSQTLYLDGGLTL